MPEPPPSDIDLLIDELVDLDALSSVTVAEAEKTGRTPSQSDLAHPDDGPSVMVDPDLWLGNDVGDGAYCMLRPSLADIDPLEAAIADIAGELAENDTIPVATGALGDDEPLDDDDALDDDEPLIEYGESADDEPVDDDVDL